MDFPFSSQESIERTLDQEGYVFVTDLPELAFMVQCCGFNSISAKDSDSLLDHINQARTGARASRGICLKYVCYSPTKSVKEAFERVLGECDLECKQDGFSIFRKDFFLWENASYLDELKARLKKYVAQHEGKPEGALPEVEDVKELLDWQIQYDSAGNEKSRKVQQTVKNWEIVLEHDARFAERIGFNEFSNEIYLMYSVPWEHELNHRAWGSADDAACFAVIQADYGLKNRQDCFDALSNVARRHKFHPIRDLLDSLTWDGQDHIGRLLSDYLGAEDSAYNRGVWRLFMVGAISRVYSPGCKFDYCPILEGRQGLGKSTFLQMMALNDLWFNDSLDSLDGDRAAQSLMGSWIVELAELKSIARTAGGPDSVKRFISAVQDKLRLPYAKRTDLFPRQTVFCGTTNKSDFLQDQTGNRRFLIVETGINEVKKNLFSAEAQDDIRQAWAQAVHLYKAENPKLVLDAELEVEARERQEAALSDDGKRGLIEDYLSGKHRVCILEIWENALDETGRPQKWQSSEIADIVLSVEGWSKMKSPGRFGTWGKQRGYVYKPVYKVDEKSKNGSHVDGFLEVSEEEIANLPFD